MATKEIQNLIDVWQQALNAHDVEALVDLFTEDAEFITSFRILDEGLDFRGRDGIRRFFTQTFLRYPRLQSQVQKVVADSDAMAVEYVWGSPEENGEIDWVVTALIAEIANGRFSAFRFYKRVYS